MKKIYSILMVICFIFICGCENANVDSDKIEEKKTVTVEYNVSGGGVIEGESTQSVETRNGISVAFKEVIAKANEGYFFVKWSDGKTEPQRNDILIENGSFTAIFEKHTKIEYLATEGGMILGNSCQYLNKGIKSEEVEAFALSGYRFIGWNDGKTEAKRSDVAENDVFYIATFEKIKYSKISYLTTDGGMISGAVEQVVENGQSTTTVKAVETKKGYYFEKWSDGVMTPERSDIAGGDTEITAIFSNKYKVIYEATDGGQIVGKNEQEVEYGKEYESVEAIANGGYVFVRWDDGNENAVREDKIKVGEKTVVYKAVFRKPYTIDFLFNDLQGEVLGEVTQIVPEGEISKKVLAKANDGYEFLCWSDGSTEKEKTVVVTENTIIYAYFTPKSTGLPVVSITTETGKDVTSKTEYIGCTITLFDTIYGEHFTEQTAQIRGRGNSTWNLPKKPYKIKFETKQDFFDNGKAKTWVLLADHRDYSLVRNMLAFEVGEELSQLKATPDCQSVEVYLNGKYHGVYLLCEQIEVNNHRVEINEDITTNEPSFLVEMDGWDDDVQVYVPDKLNSGRKYTVKFPESDEITSEQKQYIEKYLNECMIAIQGNDYEKVCQLIDVKSFAQCYIIYDLFKNPDTNYSSLYFYKDAGGKLICGPLWDFDMSIGNVSHKGNGVFENTNTLWSKEQCPWFYALLKHSEFVSLVGEELKECAPIIRETLARKYDEILSHGDAYKKNFEKWNILGKQTWSNPYYLVNIKTWEEHIEYIKNYLEKSLQNLETVYCNEG